MIVPIIIGVAIAKLEREVRYSRNLALYAGIVIGIVSGLQILPLAYPFYSITNPQISIPNMVFIYTYFLNSDIIVWRIGIQNILMSPTIVLIFIPVCILGSLLGFYLGSHFLKKQDQEIWT